MNRLFALASPPQRHALSAVLETARRRNTDIWLVGGPVRDALLGLPFGDLDFTVPEDAAGFAAELAPLLGGRAHSFPHFLTAKVLLESGEDIDIASARRERYDRPGALPRVEPGSPEDDLLRRDFRANAMGLELRSGDLSDPANGRRDLEHRRFSVLHERSFLDDPTRILRGLRLGSRLGFDFDGPTARLAREAIAGGAMETVSRERLWRELRLAFDEPKPGRAVEALAAFGALDALLGAPLAGTAGLQDLPLVDAVIAADGGIDRAVVLLSLLLPPSADSPALDRSGLDLRQRRELETIRTRRGEVTRALARAAGREERLRLLEGASPELLTLLEIDPRTAEAARDFRAMSARPLDLHGDQLGVEPGPHVGRALRDARLAAHLGTVRPERLAAFARERALEYLRSGRRSNR